MFDKINQRLDMLLHGEERLTALQTAHDMFKTTLAGTMGDAAPANRPYATDELIAGVHSLRTQVDEAATVRTDLASANRIMDELLAERALIAEKLGLVEEEEATISVEEE